MTPIVSAAVTWLKAKFPTKASVPAPNDERCVRADGAQYNIFFISSASDAIIAVSTVKSFQPFPPVQTRNALLIATSAAVANDPAVQSAIEANTVADATYLAYLDVHEVKKWPRTAP